VGLCCHQHSRAWLFVPAWSTSQPTLYWLRFARANNALRGSLAATERRESNKDPNQKGS